MKQEHKRYILNNIDRKSVDEIARNLNIKERKIKKFLNQHRGKRSKMTTSPEQIGTTEKKSLFLSLALIIILGFAVYSNSINGNFKNSGLGLYPSLIASSQYLIASSNCF